MKPDNNSFIDDDLPKIVGNHSENNEDTLKEESLINNEPEIVDNVVEEVSPSRYLNDRSEPATIATYEDREQEDENLDFKRAPSAGPEIDPEELERATIGTLLNTMKIDTNLTKNFDQPLEAVKKKTPKLLIGFLIIVALAAIVFSIIQLINPTSNNSSKNKDNNPAINFTTSKVKPAENDEVTYASKIITEVPNKVLLFKTDVLNEAASYKKESVYLYINSEQDLMLTIGNDQAVITEETIGYKVSNLTNKIANINVINSECDISLVKIYLISTDGYVFMINVNKLLTEGKLETIYNNLKTAEVDPQIGIEMLTAITGVRPIKAFTTLVESPNSCMEHSPYVLTDDGAAHVLRYNKERNSLVIAQRYFGHINVLSNENGPEYYIYKDKTISDIEGNLITDANGQNFKIQTIFASNNQEQIEEFKTPYVFISTDNKMLYFKNEGSMEVVVSNNTVTNITPSLAIEIEPLEESEQTSQSDNKEYLIEFDDATNRTISAKNGVNLIDIQTLIDTSIN